MQAAEVYRQRIAQQNNVLLGKDDPIMILLTIFEQYEDDVKVMGEAERQRFLSLLELEQQKWTDESTRRADRIVARSLSVVQTETENTFKSLSEGLVTRLDGVLGLRIADIAARDRTIMYAALVNIICTCALAIFFLLS